MKVQNTNNQLNAEQEFNQVLA